jgi:hypothetical protein
MKLKKSLFLLLAVLTLLFCAACGKEEAVEIPVPEEAQLKSICQLSVLEGYFHNVYKYNQENAEKFLWMSKNKRFWLEYTGIAKYGIDASQVSMEVEGQDITITLPKAKLLYCKVDSTSLTEDSYIVDQDSAKIKAEDSKNALTQAQAKLETEAADYEPLLTLAQQQTEKLMEEYVHNIAAAAGADTDYYTIHWNYLNG